jgi:hypothetical protein
LSSAWYKGYTITLKNPPYALDKTIGFVKSFIKGVWGIPI